MDISSTELKTMKAKQLRRIIREAIQEVLSEDMNALVTTKTGTKSVSYKNPTELSALKADSNVASITTTSGQKLKETDEIDEMARLAKGFRLADPNIDSSSYTKTISGTPLSAIIDYFRDNPGAEKTGLQSQFGFVRPQIANAIVNGLLDAGVLVKLSAGGEVEEPTAPGEATPIAATEPEDMFMGTAANPLSMYFDNEPNDDGTEDITGEEEPSEDEIEKAEKQPNSMSDDDYEAFMRYDDLKNRLDATKSNILKLKRGKGGVQGDIGDDKPSTELVRLRDLKQSLEDRMGKLISGSGYLKRKIEKETGKAYVEPVTVEPEEVEDDEAVVAEQRLDEYSIRKMQHYAGIL